MARPDSHAPIGVMGEHGHKAGNKTSSETPQSEDADKGGCGCGG